MVPTEASFSSSFSEEEELSLVVMVVCDVMVVCSVMVVVGLEEPVMGMAEVEVVVETEMEDVRVLDKMVVVVVVMVEEEEVSKMVEVEKVLGEVVDKWVEVEKVPEEVVDK